MGDLFNLTAAELRITPTRQKSVVKALKQHTSSSLLDGSMNDVGRAETIDDAFHAFGFDVKRDGEDVVGLTYPFDKLPLGACGQDVVAFFDCFSKHLTGKARISFTLGEHRVTLTRTDAQAFDATWVSLSVERFEDLIGARRFAEAVEAAGSALDHCAPYQHFGLLRTKLWALEQLKRSNEAAAVCEELLRHPDFAGYDAPSRASFKQDFARRFVAAGAFDRAEVLFEEAIALDDTRFDPFEGLLSMFSAREERERALALVQSVLGGGRKRPSDFKTERERGFLVECVKVLIGFGRWDEVMALAEETLRHAEGGFPFMRWAIGRARFQRGEYAQALADFEHAAKHLERRRDNWRARCLEALGRKRAAMSSYRRTIAEMQGKKGTWRLAMIAEALLELGEVDEADAVFRARTSASPPLDPEELVIQRRIAERRDRSR